jgi:hypothetical protein
MTLEDATKMELQSTSRKSLLGERRVGDAHSWIIPLNTSAIAVPPPHPNHLIDFAAFKVTTRDAMYSNPYVPKDLNYYIIVTHAICELSLRY